MEQRPLTVTQISTYFKQIFDAEELLFNVRVVGEISGLSIVRNVAYFVLKDEGATMSCVCFDISNFSYQNGDKVILTGTPRYYVKGGKLNFNVQKVEKFGLGELYQQFLKLKADLEAKGYFEESHKIPMPKNIKRIGVVTSKEGAVIQDIINVRTRRNPYIDIVLYPVRVQGIGAEYEIAKGIKFLDNYNVDAVIVARGGGSLEDLAPFNTKVVADAVFCANKFILSAVGHETDYTICDFCSDLRAPTPSVAAELLCSDMGEQISKFYSLLPRLRQSIQTIYIEKHASFAALSRNLIDTFNSKNVLNANMLSKRVIRLKYAANNFYSSLDNKFKLLENKLQKLNPSEVLKLGFAVVKKNSEYIGSVKNVNIGDDIIVMMSDGKIYAKVNDKG